MAGNRHSRVRSALVRHGARVVGVVVALFVVGVLFLSAHVAALRRSLEAHVGGLRAAQAVQRALVSGGPPEERSRALSELRFSLAEIPDRTPAVNTAAARLGVITTPGSTTAEQADALDGLVSALREASSAISHRLGATWTWLAAYAVAAILLAGLAWWLSRQIQRARLRAEELYASLQAETASRLAAQAERQAYERLLDQVIEHAPIAIAIHGDDGRLLRRNPEHERLFGGARGPADEALERARRGEATAGEEHVVQRQGAPALVVELAAAPVPGAGGVESVVLFARDVTEARRRQQQAWAEDRATMVATMARGMGHELRNPLTFVLGNIDWLLDEVTHTEGLSEETRRTWEQALVDMADGAARLRGAASDLGALGGHGAAGRCDPREAVRLAARLVAELGEVARVVVEPGRAPLVRGSLAHVALLISDVLRRVAALLGASGGAWLVRVGCEPDGDGARVQVTVEAETAQAEQRGALSPEAVERAFGATPSATVAPMSGLLSHLSATLEAVVVQGALRVRVGLGAPDAELPAGDPAPSGSRT